MLDFDGFSPELFTLLTELKANNDRTWFAANKERYESDVREPTLAFIRAMEPKIEAISEHFVADDRKSGGSMMRIYRDVRFSKDKSPYKTNVGLQFRHEGGKDVHAPGFYLHIEPNELYVGIGLWRPPTSILTKIRTKISNEPERWRSIIEDSPHASTFSEGGESLKRPPNGFDKDHPMIEQLKRKSFIASTSFERASMFDAAFSDHVAYYFETATPYIAFLCEAIGVEF